MSKHPKMIKVENAVREKMIFEKQNFMQFMIENIMNASDKSAIDGSNGKEKYAEMPRIKQKGDQR